MSDLGHRRKDDGKARWAVCESGGHRRGVHEHPFIHVFE